MADSRITVGRVVASVRAVAGLREVRGVPPDQVDQVVVATADHEHPRVAGKRAGGELLHALDHLPAPHLLLEALAAGLERAELLPQQIQRVQALLLARVRTRSPLMTVEQ